VFQKVISTLHLKYFFRSEKKSHWTKSLKHALLKNKAFWLVLHKTNLFQLFVFYKWYFIIEMFTFTYCYFTYMPYNKHIIFFYLKSSALPCIIICNLHLEVRIQILAYNWKLSSYLKEINNLDGFQTSYWIIMIFGFI